MKKLVIATVVVGAVVVAGVIAANLLELDIDFNICKDCGGCTNSED